MHLRNIFLVAIITISLMSLGFAATGKVIELNSATSRSDLTITTINSNITNFTDLLDTPVSYAGEGSNCVKVNAGEDGLEFGSCSTSSVTYNATYALWAYNQSSWLYDTYNANWLTTYNVTYHGLINNASYLSTYNATYAVSGNATWNQSLTDGLYSAIKWGYNMSNWLYDTYATAWTATYNVTYNGLINNASYLSTYNVTYHGLINNASYLSTYNATYASAGNATFNQSLTDGLYPNIKWGYNMTTISNTYADNHYLNRTGTNADQNINIGSYNISAQAFKVNSSNYVYHNGSCMVLMGASSEIHIC